MKKRLKLLSLTFSQVQTGAYAIILAEEDGQRRIPVIIGTPEAQAIAIFIDELKSPRPLTHDLFVSFMNMLGVTLSEVYIYKYDEGIFFSDLIFNDGQREIHLDARTSDAIALALRTEAIITIEESAMKETAIMMDDTEYFDVKTENSEQMDIGSLQNALDEAIAEEDYEHASYLRDLINNKKKLSR
ncbi:MAG: bifunctional nuclease family protein [Dysgonamonadaceae bacterium]|jgi:bifunctional DNase/RNase|nr:bifunctional nuclease family protein [Dysgonamonadaceae bacterium]